MSATAKQAAFLLAFLALGSGAPALAQSSRDSGSDAFISGLVANAPSTPDPDSQIREVIDRMIADVAGNLSSGAATGADDAVTIRDIDRQNRLARELETDLMIQERRFKKLTSQLEMLVALQNARKTFAGAAGDASAQTPDSSIAEKDRQIAELQAQLEEEKKKREAVQADLAREQQMIPRLDAVFGLAGQMQARLYSVAGAEQVAREGSLLADGFRVVEIRQDGVVLQAASGRKYLVVPSSDSGTGSAIPPTDADEPAKAIDLGATDGFPFPVSTR